MKVECQKQMVDLPTTTREYLFAQRDSGIGVGDIVRVKDKATSDCHGWLNDWNRYMTSYIGMSCMVTQMNNVCGIELDGSYSFPYFVLEVVEKFIGPVMPWDEESELLMLSLLESSYSTEPVTSDYLWGGT